MASDMRIQHEPQWEGILRDLIDEPGKVVILGETDSGKSTLARYLLAGLLGKGEKVALVDSDIGQSSLGPPGTVSASTFRTALGLHDYTAEKMFFVGSLNQATAIPLILRGVREMLPTFHEGGVILTIVDTSGLVRGPTGQALKAAKMRIVQPRHVIALQRRQELENILDLCVSSRLHRLQVSGHARRRSRQARARYRLEMFRRHFRDAGTMDIPLGAVELLDVRRQTDFETTLPAPGTVVGLNQDGKTLSLGLVVKISPHFVTVKTPLRFPDRVTSLVISAIVLTSSDIWP